MVEADLAGYGLWPREPPWDLGDVAATFTRAELLVERPELETEVARDLRIGGEEVQDVALRRLLPHARKARKQGHQPTYLRRLLHRRRWLARS
jgi:hypothetical protein